ncbi:MAG TPA: hypothetical protein VGM81_01785 [Burkholderiaceae bacterium]|jgi:hypothetical protein
MNSFWSDHWWAIPLWLAGVALMIAAIMDARRNPDARRSKVIFFLLPQFDPAPERPSASILKMVLLFLMLLVLILTEVLN